MDDVIKKIIKYVGDDPDREGLQNAGISFKETLDTFLCGYKIDIDKIFCNTFTGSYESAIFIKNIDLTSMCEDHFLPSFGLVTIAYLPDKKMTGIGDFTTLVNALSRRLQLQERLTNQIGEAIDKYLNPKGVAVRICANHLCMKTHKYHNKSDEIITSYFSGAFKSNEQKINEFWNNI